jgi:hypothetical protein
VVRELAHLHQQVVVEVAVILEVAIQLAHQVVQVAVTTLMLLVLEVLATQIHILLAKEMLVAVAQLEMVAVAVAEVVLVKQEIQMDIHTVEMVHLRFHLGV